MSYAVISVIAIFGEPASSPFTIGHSSSEFLEPSRRYKQLWYVTSHSSQLNHYSTLLWNLNVVVVGTEQVEAVHRSDVQDLAQRTNLTTGIGTYLLVHIVLEIAPPLLPPRGGIARAPVLIPILARPRRMGMAEKGDTALALSRRQVRVLARAEIGSITGIAKTRSMINMIKGNPNIKVDEVVIVVKEKRGRKRRKLVRHLRAFYTSYIRLF